MAKKKTAKKEAPVTADEIPVEEYDGTRYTPWIPGNMPIGGKSNSTEQLNDHPTEHNHSAEAINDIVDRFADLRLYVPAANSCGVAGVLKVDSDLIVDGVADLQSYGVSLHTGCYGITGHPGNPAFSSKDDATSGIYFPGAGRVSVTLAGADAFSLNEYGIYSNRTFYGVGGSIGYPAYSFQDDATSGIYYTGPDPGWDSKAIVSISANGSQAANFGDKGCSIPPAYASTVPNRANMYIDSDGALHRSTAAVFDIEESDYNELVEKVAALTAQIETLIERVESLERSTPITADA